jgi:hypothetical protein
LNQCLLKIILASRFSLNPSKADFPTLKYKKAKRRLNNLLERESTFWNLKK